MYFDASDACHDLNFQLGQTGIGTSLATRTWSIKITQYSCNYENLAPSGCDQYYYGTGAMNMVKTFNFDGGKHLADQMQTICVRREAGNCRICWTADALTDVQVSKDGGKIDVHNSFHKLKSSNNKANNVFRLRNVADMDPTVCKCPVGTAS